MHLNNFPCKSLYMIFNYSDLLVIFLSKWPEHSLRVLICVDLNLCTIFNESEFVRRAPLNVPVEMVRTADYESIWGHTWNTYAWDLCSRSHKSASPLSIWNGFIGGICQSCLQLFVGFWSRLKWAAIIMAEGSMSSPDWRFEKDISWQNFHFILIRCDNGSCEMWRISIWRRDTVHWRLES